jgi:hypothetical protein
MALNNQGALTINTKVIQYENRVKVEAGSATRNAYPQVNGGLVVVEDISTKVSKITVPIRVTSESNETFDEFYDNKDNNIITFRDKNYSGCFMEVKPEREDLEVVEYVFMGNPEV